MNVSLIKFIDKFVGQVFLYPLAIYNKYKPKRHGTLFIQLWGVGETILTLPAIKWYHAQNPDREITILCTERNMEVYNGLDYIDHIRVISMNPFSLIFYKERYTQVYDFEEYLNISTLFSKYVGKIAVGFDHNIRGKVYDNVVYYDDTEHCLEIFCSLVGAPVPKKLEPIITKKTSYKFDKRRVALFPGCAESAPERAWPKFNELYHVLKAKGWKPIMVAPLGGKIDCEYDQFDGDLHEMAHFFTTCAYCISNDTGPMHLSAAMGCKTIGLFGANLPQRWKPWGKGNIAIFKNIPCSPHIFPKEGRMEKCNNDGQCIKSITVDDVLRCIK